MAFISCILTLKLTASTSFVTRKESGVLSEEFAGGETKAAATSAGAEPKRRVLYYVSLLPFGNCAYMCIYVPKYCGNSHSYRVQPV